MLMDDMTHMLITVLYFVDETLVRFALSIDSDDIPEHITEYPLEPESREFIRAMLPDHIKTMGPIVDVSPLFDNIVIVAEAKASAHYMSGVPMLLREGEPCAHPGCLSHLSHPCEGCGRIAGRYVEK